MTLSCFVGIGVKSFVSNLSVFVVTGLLFFLAFLFLLQAADLALSQFFTGPIETVANFLFGTIVVGAATGQFIAGWPPLLLSGPVSVAFLYLLVSLGIFFMIPKATDIIKSIISGRPFAYGTAIGQAIGPLALGAAGGELLVGRRIEDRQQRYGRTTPVADLEATRAVLGSIKSWIGRAGR